jgi:hypothetical protein
MKLSLPLRTMLIGLPLLFSGVAAHAASGSFSTLAYNVSGLPQAVNSAPSERVAATKPLRRMRPRLSHRLFL